MIVHFVCEGNSFRSRLAETHLSSLKNPKIEAISSGIIARENRIGPVSWYAQRLIQKNHLIPFEKITWTQTTAKNIIKGDLTVFMTQAIYDFCVKNYGFSSPKYEIWNIKDVLKDMDDSEKMDYTEKAFEEIKNKVADLVKKYA